VIDRVLSKTILLQSTLNLPKTLMPLQTSDQSAGTIFDVSAFFAFPQASPLTFLLFRELVEVADSFLR